MGSWGPEIREGQQLVSFLGRSSCFWVGPRAWDTSRAATGECDSGVLILILGGFEGCGLSEAGVQGMSGAWARRQGQHLVGRFAHFRLSVGKL